MEKTKEIKKNIIGMMYIMFKSYFISKVALMSNYWSLLVAG